MLVLLQLIFIFISLTMINFGYNIVKSSAISLDDIDYTKFKKLSKVEPDVLKCMACGSCAASCTAAKYSDMNLRKVILLLSRGKEQDAVRMLQNCMLCGKCILVCPRGINTRHLISSIIKIYQNSER